jgi:hypothetical protein
MRKLWPSSEAKLVKKKILVNQVEIEMEEDVWIRTLCYWNEQGDASKQQFGLQRTLVLLNTKTIRDTLIGLFLSLEIPWLFKSQAYSCLLYKVERLPASI